MLIDLLYSLKSIENVPPPMTETSKTPSKAKSMKTNSADVMVSPLNARQLRKTPARISRKTPMTFDDENNEVDYDDSGKNPKRKVLTETLPENFKTPRSKKTSAASTPGQVLFDEPMSLNDLMSSTKKSNSEFNKPFIDTPRVGGVLTRRRAKFLEQ